MDGTGKVFYAVMDFGISSVEALGSHQLDSYLTYTSALKMEIHSSEPFVEFFRNLRRYSSQVHTLHNHPSLCLCCH